MDRERTFELTRRYLNAGKIETYERYVFSLSEPEREEYWYAWAGESEDGEPVEESCLGRTSSEVGPVPQREVFNLARVNEAEDRILGLVAVDPRLVESDQLFASCVAAAGYDFRTYSDASAYVAEKADQELERLQQGSVDLSVLWESGDWSLVMPEDRLEQLRDEEIMIAPLAWDCADDVRIVRDEVTAEIELEVVRTEYQDVAIDLGIDLDP